MEVGELMAFKPVTAPKRPAHKDDFQGMVNINNSLYLIQCIILNLTRSKCITTNWLIVFR